MALLPNLQQVREREREEHDFLFLSSPFFGVVGLVLGFPNDDARVRSVRRYEGL